MSIHKKKDGDPQKPVPADGAGPAVPPPDDPLRRHGADPDAAEDREAARRRLEAILHSRRMPDEQDEPEEPDGS